MNRYSVLAVLVAGSLPFTVGCSTKNYVRNQTTPIINNVNELDDQTAKNTRDIRDVDTRSQQGIAQVNSKADAADQKAHGRRSERRPGKPECHPAPRIA